MVLNYVGHLDIFPLKSWVRKDKAKYRLNMGNNMLNTIIIHKTLMSSMQMHFHDSTLSTELLKKSKSATYIVLNE